MEFEKALTAASQYLTFTPRLINPAEPQGLWFCDSLITAADIGANAVCLGTGCSWDDVPRCRPFLEAFPFLVIVSPNAIAREQMHRELQPRLPAMDGLSILDDLDSEMLAGYCSMLARRDQTILLNNQLLEQLGVHDHHGNDCGGES